MRHSRAVVGHRIARVTVFLAVIRPGLVTGCDNERLVIGSHSQRTIVLGDLVVGGLGALIQCVFKRIFAGPDTGLAAREDVGGTFTHHEAVLHSKRRGAVHQRVAVVRLRKVFGSEGHWTLRDAEREGGVHTAVVRAGSAGNHRHGTEISDSRDFGDEGAAAVDAVGHRRRAGTVNRTGTAGTTQLRAVIRLLALTGQRDDKSIARRDGQPTVRHREGHRAKVRVRVGELVLRSGRGTLQVHIRGTDIRALSRGVTAVGEVIHVVKRIGNTYVITRHTLFSTIINLRVRMARDDHLGVNRGDGLVAVRDVERHLVEVRIGIGEHRSRQTHVGLAVGIAIFHHIGSGSGGRTAEDKVDVVTCHLVQVGA